MDYQLVHPDDYEPPRIGRSPKSIQQYVQAGLEHGILFLGSDGTYDPETKLWRVGRRPSSIKVSTRWVCPNCTRGEMTKSYFSVTMFDNYGCRCQNGKSLTREEYHAFATERDILWVPEFDLLPHNVKVVTQWLGKDGELFKASKWELENYGRPPNRRWRDKFTW